MKRYIEPCSPEELTIESMRKRLDAFNEMFNKVGGRKGYELQCIEILLAEIDRLQLGKPASNNQEKK